MPVRASHRLDDHGRDGGGIVQVDEAGQLVGQVSTPLRLAATEGLLGPVVGGRQVVDARQHVAELLAVGDHAADRDAAEADAVIAALAADEAGAGALSLGLVVAERNLQRRVDCLAAPSWRRTRSRGRRAPATKGAKPARNTLGWLYWKAGE